MTNVSDICEDLGNFGEMLGNLSPRFGMQTARRNEEAAASFKLNPAILNEIANLGGMLKDLSPRDVCIFG